MARSRVHSRGRMVREQGMKVQTGMFAHSFSVGSVSWEGLRSCIFSWSSSGS